VAGAITFDTVVPLLLEAIPEFPSDADDVAENLVYLVFSDVMRFLKRELESNQNEDLLKRMFAFLEDVAQSQDARVTEMLQDALYELVIPDPDTPRSFMGRSTRKLFGQVVKEVYG